ncbi:MAG: FdtA/QdtA family cupin domain-containing protein [Muribaculaceae bacterium]|nr:FdtA/QdtA family cupin domain-containing protein [Muribaculaceae bacterium]
MNSVDHIPASDITVSHCRIYGIKHIDHANGSLAVIQNDTAFPFIIRRGFYIYDIPSDCNRGGHAHRATDQFIVAVSGSFRVTFTDGTDTREMILSRPYEGLYIPAGIWVQLDGFSSGSICMAICSDIYDEADYIRDFNEFRASKSICTK